MRRRESRQPRIARPAGSAPCCDARNRFDGAEGLWCLTYFATSCVRNRRPLGIVIQAWRRPMTTATEYRIQAKDCEEFARRTNDPALKAALTSLAREYFRAAHQTE